MPILGGVAKILKYNNKCKFIRLSDNRLFKEKYKY